MQLVTKITPKKRRCRWCKAFFKPKVDGRPQIYCKPACRQRAYEKRKWTPLSEMDALSLDLLSWRAKQRFETQMRHRHMIELLQKGVVPLTNPAQLDGVLDAEKPPDRSGVLRGIEDACRKRGDEQALATITRWRLERQV